MCLAEGHKAVTPVRLEPAASRSRVKHSNTEPLRSRGIDDVKLVLQILHHKLLSLLMEIKKGTNISAIILVPLIMTLSRGHTGQIKGTAIMR